MSRKSKTLILILGILALLGGGYYGSTVWKGKKAVSEPLAYTPPIELGNLESSELVKIEGPGITMEKINGTWELTYLSDGIPPGGIDLDQSSILYMTYSLAQVWAEKVIDEDPEDLSAYGLDNPLARTVVTDSAGRQAVYILGNMTPSMDTYYFMTEGDPKVYTIVSYEGRYLQFFLDNIRNRYLFSFPDLTAVMRLIIEIPETKMEFVPIDASPKSLVSTIFSTHILTSPYFSPKGANSEAMDKMLAPFKNLMIEDFIDDDPSSLEPYGLDKPVRVLLQTENASVDLLIGGRVDGKYFAKLADAPGIFTLSDMDGIVNAKPFALVDKFILLVNIDIVEHLTITGGERDLKADFQGIGDEGVYYFNGKKAETKSFKNWYQTVIGLMADAEYPADGFAAPERNSQDNTGNITIEYQLNTSPGQRAAFTLIPFNRDFYTVEQEGQVEFLLSRNQVRKMFEMADSIGYEE